MIYPQSCVKTSSMYECVRLACALLTLIVCIGFTASVAANGPKVGAIAAGKASGAALKAKSSTASGKTSAVNPKIHGSQRATGKVTLQFNRNGSTASQGWKKRVHPILDGTKSVTGHRSHEYKNDGRNGSVVLPKKTPGGKKITYTTTYVRPGKHIRKKSNARLTTGSDGSAWISRHHGDGGERVKRIQ